MSNKPEKNEPPRIPIWGGTALIMLGALFVGKRRPAKTSSTSARRLGGIFSCMPHRKLAGSSATLAEMNWKASSQEVGTLVGVRWVICWLARVMFSWCRVSGCIWQRCCSNLLALCKTVHGHWALWADMNVDLVADLHVGKV